GGPRWGELVAPPRHPASVSQTAERFGCEPGGLHTSRSSGGPGLLDPQHEFLDFRGPCASKASFRRDDAKPALLEDATRRDVVVCDASVEGPTLIDDHERL